MSKQNYKVKPIVAIVGRPNVGKSTLFNRISGTRLAIVEPTPGVTRDRLYAECNWFGTEFILIDTGGLQFKEQAPFVEEIRRQAEFAMEEADLIVFAVDGKSGLSHIDYDIADLLRHTGKPVVLAVNKVESKKRADDALEFYALGLGDPITVSALHGQDVDMLLDTIAEMLPVKEIVYDDEDDDRLRVAIVGRPNVGKSSLLNTVIAEDRAIVSDTPGTTRDAIDMDFDWKLPKKKGEQDDESGDDTIHFTFTDTAGIRRKSKIDEDVEYYSVVRAFSAIDRSDVVLMLINAEDGVTDQDKRIAGYAEENGKAMVIAVNKWDALLTKKRYEEGLVEDNRQITSQMRTQMLEEFTKDVRHELIFANWAPVVYISALKKKGIDELLSSIYEVSHSSNVRISSSDLNRLVAEAHYEKPASRRGRALKIYYATQVNVCPPTFVFFVNDSELMHFSTVRYFENRLRETFPFEGTPIKIKVKQSSGREEAEKKSEKRRAK